jgi:Zn-dependent peptidase ImmA (M78 family)
MKIKYKFYKTFKDIFCAYWGIKKSELKEAKCNFFHKNELLTYEEIEENLGNSAWGFYSKQIPNTIHIWWNGKNKRELLETIAHEIGHAVGKPYKNLEKEEKRADLYADVTLEANRIYDKIMNKKT